MRSRGTFIYILMLGLFGVGLWAILGYGSALLRAPEDLAGEWELYAADALPEDDPLMPMSVQQSGMFFKITLGDRAVDLRLVEEQRYEWEAQKRARLRLAGPDATISFDGRRGGDQFEVQLEGPLRGTWVARRQQRAFTRAPTAESAQNPAPALPHARR